MDDIYEQRRDDGRVEVLASDGRRIGLLTPHRVSGIEHTLWTVDVPDGRYFPTCSSRGHARTVLLEWHRGQVAHTA